MSAQVLEEAVGRVRPAWKYCGVGLLGDITWDRGTWSTGSFSPFFRFRFRFFFWFRTRFRLVSSRFVFRFFSFRFDSVSFSSSFEIFKIFKKTGKNTNPKKFRFFPGGRGSRLVVVPCRLSLCGC